jgi:hypothetical protein
LFLREETVIKALLISAAMPDKETSEKPLTTGEWFITLFVLAIPVIGLVMHFVWAFGGGGNAGRRNFCRAVLLWIAVGFCLGLLALIGFFILGGTMAALFNRGAHR